MLFDLRGRGRRTAVRIIYLGLALLMGGGLIFFGIGGAGGGGLLDAVNNNGGSGGDQLAKEAKRLELRARRTPANEHLWAEAARTRYEDAGSGSHFDQVNGFDRDGVALLKLATRDWERYLGRKPTNPDASIAAVMAQAYAALGRYAKAAGAQELVTAAQPSTGTYGQLAQYAWAANQTRTGDLAEEKAIALAPKDQRNIVKSNLDEAKAQFAQARQQTSTTP